MRVSALLLTTVLAACGGGQRPATTVPGAGSAPASPAAGAKESPVERAERLFAASEYRLAEAAFRDGSADPKSPRVALGLAETLLFMGRYSEVLALLPPFEREPG